MTKIGVDVETNQEERNKAEEEDGMDDNGSAAGLKTTELQATVVPRNLEQKPRRQKDEQHRRHKHWSPIFHLSLSLLTFPLYLSLSPITASCRSLFLPSLDLFSVS